MRLRLDPAGLAGHYGRMKSLPLPCILLAALFLAGLPVTLSGGEPPWPLDPATVNDVLDAYPEPLSYGIYVMGNKAGWMDQTVSREADRVRIDCRTNLEILAMNQRISITQTDIRVYQAQAPWQLVSAEFATTQNGEGTRGRISFQDGAWCRQVAGRPDELVDLSATTLWSELLMDFMLRLEGRPGVTRSHQGVSLPDSLPLGTTVTLKSVSTQLVGGVAVELYVWDQQVDGVTMEVFTDRAGQLVKGYAGGVMELRREAPATAHNLAASQDLFDCTVLRVDRPLGGTAGGRLVRLGLPAVQASRLPDLPGQAVVPAGSGSEVTLTVPRASRLPAGDSEVQDALKPESRYPAGLPRIQELARQALAGISGEAGRLKVLVAFVSGYLANALIPDSLDMDSLLDRRRGDCSEHSRLFVTLARAAGIPAREVTGFYYMGDTLMAWGAHAWAEVLLDGAWHMVDPVMNQFDIDVYHLATGFGPGGMLDSLGLFRGATARVLAVE